MGGDPGARVNATWDAWFLDRHAAGEADAVAALGGGAVEVTPAAAGTRCGRG
jgi:2,3-dihydroxyphenylpropionate 1,2-dioxygenase